ncbi:hypothetical protein PVAP13_2KG025100 [Panicum virgatum]|uniref:Uncharacterized protein n=1 Tax=Panicum virgatum TaxID=38727 RepID=A0A8T0W6R6_PANVG|nr:hypothetical protein PVAP13_2KG025100 [Panicum virgatum]
MWFFLHHWKSKKSCGCQRKACQAGLPLSAAQHGWREELPLCSQHCKGVHRVVKGPATPVALGLHLAAPPRPARGRGSGADARQAWRLRCSQGFPKARCAHGRGGGGHSPYACVRANWRGLGRCCRSSRSLLLVYPWTPRLSARNCKRLALPRSASVLVRARDAKPVVSRAVIRSCGAEAEAERARCPAGHGSSSSVN